MKSEAMKRQGFRTDLTSSQVVTKLRTDDSREYVGTQTVTEAFVPIISEDIRKKIAEGDTFDNEGKALHDHPEMEMNFFFRIFWEQTMM